MVDWSGDGGTSDPTNVRALPLSYFPAIAEKTGFEPATPRSQSEVSDIYATHRRSSLEPSFVWETQGKKQQGPYWTFALPLSYTRRWPDDWT